MRIISKIPVREYYPEILNGTDPYMDFAALAGTYNLRRGYVRNSIDLSNFWQENPNFILDFDWSKMGEVGKFEPGTAISFLYDLQTGTFD